MKYVCSYDVLANNLQRRHFHELYYTDDDNCLNESVVIA
jgi:hypothetical protein